MAALDVRLRKYAIGISAVALVPAVLSALAAWGSLTTARSAIELQRSTAAASGAQLEVVESMYVKGACNGSPDRLRAVVGVRNIGHLRGYVTGLRINLVPPNVVDSVGIGLKTYSPIGVDPQSVTYIELPLDCGEITTHGLNAADAQALNEKLAESIIDHNFDWYVIPTYVVMDKYGPGPSYRIEAIVVTR